MSSVGKKRKPMNKLQEVLPKQDMTRRSHVMNDDIIELIFNELSVKQLLRLESVSNQFMDCVGSALQKNNGLSIGLGEDEVKCHTNYHSLEGTEVGAVWDPKKTDSLDVILKKCPNIKSLYLKGVAMDWPAIGVIVNRCLQLKSLYLDRIVIDTKKVKTRKAVKRLLSQLNHLTINRCKLVVSGLVIELLPQLPLIESVEYIDLKYDIEYYNDYMPPNLKRLKMKDQHFNNFGGIQRFAELCPHLRELVITEDELHDWYNEDFPILCDKYRRLNSFYFGLHFARSEGFMANIDKFNDLKHLSVINTENIKLDTNLMTPMPALRSLLLDRVVVSPQMLASISDIFPNLKRLEFKSLFIVCNGLENKDNDEEDDEKEEDEENEDEEEKEIMVDIVVYKQTINDCLKSLSKLPKLKQLLFTSCDFLINGNDLLLFTELNVLSLNDCYNCEELDDFVVKCVDKKVSNKYLKFLLDLKRYEELMTKLNDNNVSIPKYLVIKPTNVKIPTDDDESESSFEYF